MILYPEMNQHVTKMCINSFIYLRGKLASNVLITGGKVSIFTKSKGQFIPTNKLQIVTRISLLKLAKDIIFKTKRKS